MEKIRVLFDREGNTLDVWFTEPQEAVCEETGNEVLIKKHPKTGEVLGFEKLNVLTSVKAAQNIKHPVEVLVR